MFKKILMVLMFLLFAMPAFAQVDKSIVVDGDDQILYEAQRGQMLATSKAYDSGFMIKFSVATGTNTGTKAISDTLDTGYLLAGISLYTTQEVTVTYNGTDINATDGSNSFDEIVPATKSTMWDFTNVTGIIVTNNSGSSADIYVYVRSLLAK